MNLSIEKLNINNIKPYKNNAKLHPKNQIEQIKKSIQEFGMVDPIGIWSEENIIVEGHGRLIACKELGIEEVPVIRLDHLSDEERRAYALANNQTTMSSGFDPELLKIEIQNIKTIDITAFGFEATELSIEDVSEDEFEAEMPEEPKAMPGDIYQLGNHRLMCGDTTEENDMILLMGGY